MREIRVQIDDGTFKDIEEQAAAAGVPLDEFAGQVLAHAEQKRRFVTAAANYSTQLAPAFTEAFGYPTKSRPGAAAA